LFELVGLKSYFDNNGEGDTHVQQEQDNGEEDALVQTVVKKIMAHK
jgi:hypothetical protein